MDRVLAYIIYALAIIIESIFKGFIAVFEAIVILTESLKSYVLQLILAGGCLIFMLLLSPLGLIILFSPPVLIFLFIIFGIPILGKKFISLLKFWEYTSTEYLFELADYLKTGKARTFTSFSEYGDKYIRMENERQAKEREERRKAEQKMWEERFRVFYQNMGNQNGYYQYGSDQRYQEHTTGGYYPGSYDPRKDFIRKFEKSCDILQVDYFTDEYQVRLAYRQRAKEVHPDVNPSADATQKFQELSDAYDFLSKENIERYRSLKNG